MGHRWIRQRAALGSAALLAVGAAGGCIPDNHPLNQSGSVEILLDTEQAIFAADVLDEAGRPVLPRQEPYQKAVQLFITDGGEPDEGGYVNVRIDPPEALALVATDDTCEQLSGAFRCTAAEDGYANFAARSKSDWSGTATVTIADRTEEKTVTVKPAGLPDEAANFSLIIGGIGNDTNKVLASYTSLACHIGPVPDQAFDKWPAGRIRAREAVVRATPPPALPGVVEHAPVIVQSLHPEARLSRYADCRTRETRLRVMLNALGESPGFYLCFSDLGGDDIEVAYSSGEKINETPRELDVMPEPRLLRIRRLKAVVIEGSEDQAVASVDAFNANLDQVAMAVDIFSSHVSVLAPDSGSLLLAEGDDPAEEVTADALSPGTATISVAPRLYDSPLCSSDTITVAESD